MMKTVLNLYCIVQHTHAKKCNLENGEKVKGHCTVKYPHGLEFLLCFFKGNSKEDNVQYCVSIFMCFQQISIFKIKRGGNTNASTTLFSLFSMNETCANHIAGYQIKSMMKTIDIC